MLKSSSIIDLFFSVGRWSNPTLIDLAKIIHKWYVQFNIQNSTHSFDINDKVEPISSLNVMRLKNISWLIEITSSRYRLKKYFSSNVIVRDASLYKEYRGNIKCVFGIITKNQGVALANGMFIIVFIILSLKLINPTAMRPSTLNLQHQQNHDVSKGILRYVIENMLYTILRF